MGEQGTETAYEARLFQLLDEAEAWPEAERRERAEAACAAGPVRADTLDAICRAEDLEEVDFLKMNIEGAERFALLGAESIIQRTKSICVACHDFRADYGEGEEFRTREFVKQFLIEHGFKVTTRQDDPRDYVRDHLFGLN